METVIRQNNGHTQLEQIVDLLHRSQCIEFLSQCDDALGQLDFGRINDLCQQIIANYEAWAVAYGVPTYGGIHEEPVQRNLASIKAALDEMRSFNLRRDNETPARRIYAWIVEALPLLDIAISIRDATIP